jgi:hypothetical protein
MPIATGVEKVVAMKKEVTWNLVPAAASAQVMRRVKCTASLKKETYESEEMRSDYQVADFRHGVRSADVSLEGEVSPGTYQLPIAAALRRLYTAGIALTGVSLTIAGSGPTYTFTGTGFLTGNGLKQYDVIRLSVGALNAANLLKNFFILSMTNTVLTVIPLNGVAPVAEGPIATCTLTVIGRKTWVPLTGHTDESFSLEQWTPSITVSEVFSGLKVNKIDVSLPASGISKFKADLMGANITTAAAQYFTSPTAANTAGVFAAVNGAISVAGAQVALITGINFSIDAGMSADPVVGSNIYPDIFEGRVRVSGQMTVLFDSGTYRDIFLNETEVSAGIALTTSNSGVADFMTFVFPRVKFGGADKDDGEKGIVQTIPFTALLALTGGSGIVNEQTTLSIQDSLAT